MGWLFPAPLKLGGNVKKVGSLSFKDDEDQNTPINEDQNSYTVVLNLYKISFPFTGSAPASPKSSVLDLSIYPETPEDSHSLLATLSLPSCSSAPPSPHPRTSSSQKLLRKISLHRTS
jgi:hypothetical protein